MRDCTIEDYKEFVKRVDLAAALGEKPGTEIRDRYPLLMKIVAAECQSAPGLDPFVLGQRAVILAISLLEIANPELQEVPHG